jgi:hypothetical protein
MKLQDALKRIFWQFGVVVQQEKRGAAPGSRNILSVSSFC